VPRDGEIDGVLHTGGDALPTSWTVNVRGITRQEDTTIARTVDHAAIDAEIGQPVRFAGNARVHVRCSFAHEAFDILQRDRAKISETRYCSPIAFECTDGPDRCSMRRTDNPSRRR
jgi:hypothetical protein